MDWERLVSQACTFARCMHAPLQEDSADTAMNDFYSEECN